MADVNVTPQDILASGLTTSYNASLSASDTYLIPNDGATFLHFKKTGAGSCTVTIATNGSYKGLAIADQTATVPATTGDVMVGPFPTNPYNNSAGQVAVTLSNITGLSMAAYRIRPQS